MTQSNLGTILLVCTSHELLGETGHKTGFWMEELAAPWYVFLEAGYDVVIASPGSVKPPIDPSSLQPRFRTEAVKRFEADDAGMAALAASVPLSRIPDMNAFSGIFLVGGHGAMWDFPENKELTRLLDEAASSGKTIGVVCHGVTGFLAASDPKFLDTRAVAGFSNEEEAAVRLTEVVPFPLQTCLEAKRARSVAGAAFSVHVQSDGGLVTGQNPASSVQTAKAMLQAREP